MPVVLSLGYRAVAWQSQPSAYLPARSANRRRAPPTAASSHRTVGRHHQPQGGTAPGHRPLPPARTRPKPNE